MASGKGEEWGAAYLLWIEAPQLENDTFESAEGVSHVEAKAYALAEQELARKNLFGRRVRQLLREPASISTVPSPP